MFDPWNTKNKGKLIKLLTQKLESQGREGVVISNIIKLWNSVDRPVSVKNA